MQILVLGMHRSGTSMVARLLNMMGFYFGPEGISTGANQENPKGFWERRDVRALNDMLLHSAGADWYRLSDFSLEKVPAPNLARFKKEAGEIILSLDGHRPWFLKEPRLCLLAPLWLELLEFPICLIVYRSPIEVARSLETRNQFSPAFSLALWERYYIAALEATSGCRRIQINHADLIAAPIEAVRVLERSLQAHGVVGLRSPSDQEILAFIDPTLYRAKESEIALLVKLSAAQHALSATFRSEEALVAKEPPRFSAESQTMLVWEDTLARYRKQNSHFKDRNEALSTEVSNLRVQLETADRTAAESKEKLAELAEKLRQVTAALAEAQRNSLTADELRKTIQAEMALVRKAATADATDAALQARTAELSETRAEVANRIAKLQAHQREAKREKDRLNGAVKRRDNALVQSQAKVEELTARSKILKKGLAKIEASFARLRKSSSFHFMVYTARRLGLVSRTPRICVEEMKKAFLEMRRGLEKADEKTVAEKPVEQSPGRRREPRMVPFVGLREFDNQSVERITHRLAEIVSIVIPIYNSPEELRRCLESVFLHTRTPFELILVDDCSPDPAIATVLATYETRSEVRVIRSSTNQGFVRSANIGLQATQNDVVLLNSDTEVTPGWLQKLTIAAYSNPKIATVTPFSNAAGAFSVPKMGVNAPIPFPFTVVKMGRLTERVSSRAYPDVPTGNGFCMFIKREALEQIGLFDEENFGRGYAEENDFCMRARKRGWRHIIDDSLFIYHQGSSSFGEEKQALLKQNRETLDRIHPEYTGLVREFTNSADINALRACIGDQLKDGAMDLEPNKPRVLVILHEGGGGVPVTHEDLARRIGDTHQCFELTSTGSELILRAWQGCRAVEKQRWKLPGKWSAKNYRNEAARRVYFQVLTGLGIDLVHIHHLFKHSFDPPRLCRQLGIPVVLSFHDYYFACPSIHLLDQNATYCGGQCTPGMQQCTIPSPMLGDLPMLKEYLPEWREQVAQIFDCCDAFVTPVASV
ncbi:MAG TPA: glycosyltransferase, partial [Chthoniobacterales bacterium]